MAIIAGMEVSTAEAKNRLPELIRFVEGGEVVVITRHGGLSRNSGPRRSPGASPVWAA